MKTNFPNTLNSFRQNPELPDSNKMGDFVPLSENYQDGDLSRIDQGYGKYRQRRIAHWDYIAGIYGKGWGAYYHQRLAEVYRQVIPPGQRVLEIGCGQGDLLATLQPVFGVGIDFSPEMIKHAKLKYPQLDFYLCDAHDLKAGEDQFDAIILSEVLNDAWDVQIILEKVAPLCHSGTRILINFYSRLWELPLALAKRLNLAHPVLNQNWLTIDDTLNLLNLGGYEPIRTWQEILLPLPIPILSTLLNRFLVRIWPLNHLAITNFIQARPIAVPCLTEPSVSIIIPARNEEGNIERIFKSLPELGYWNEVIFVEGNSRDKTYGTIQQCIEMYPQQHASLLRQTGTGKGDAVRLGFEKACGDILMILDADLTVPPQYLHRFYKAIVSGKGDFINGVRMVYPLEKQAMRFVNFLGNKFFSLLFTWLIGQPVKDTLCGTKVLWRNDYLRIAKNRAFFGNFDPFGDFDLLFGAARLGLKIVDLPVRYRDRTYGTTNISRWKHGVLLLRMAIIAALRLKFV